MKELMPILTDATATIEPECFLLNIAGGDPVYRERIYCYELYDRMRLRWPEDCTFWLNGEVDKSGHALLGALGADGRKPDLLVIGRAARRAIMPFLKLSRLARLATAWIRTLIRCRYSGTTWATGARFI
ncbi:hypothetical protein [Bradyrhizobium sp.]|uniref:hypothetical protein n=1 Tax=Bradyrhizobium sp. TaxID=376 RepID=UPI003C366B48